VIRGSGCWERGSFARGGAKRNLEQGKGLKKDGFGGTTTSHFEGKGCPNTMEKACAHRVVGEIEQLFRGRKKIRGRAGGERGKGESEKGVKIVTVCYKERLQRGKLDRGVRKWENGWRGGTEGERTAINDLSKKKNVEVMGEERKVYVGGLVNPTFR